MKTGIILISVVFAASMFMSAQGCCPCCCPCCGCYRHGQYLSHHLRQHHLHDEQQREITPTLASLLDRSKIASEARDKGVTETTTDRVQTVAPPTQTANSNRREEQDNSVKTEVRSAEQ